MTSFWETIRRSIELQPIPARFFPIREGDLVDSPYGKFLVQRRRPLEGSDNKVMWEGLLHEWILSDGSYTKATLDDNVLVKNAKRVNVFCYDCEKRSVSDFHFVGLECGHCKGYNTCQR